MPSDLIPKTRGKRGRPAADRRDELRYIVAKLNEEMLIEIEAANGVTRPRGKGWFRAAMRAVLELEGITDLQRIHDIYKRIGHKRRKDREQATRVGRTAEMARIVYGRARARRKTLTDG
jgi:hypothetical protein